MLKGQHHDDDYGKDPNDYGRFKGDSQESEKGGSFEDEHVQKGSGKSFNWQFMAINSCEKEANVEEEVQGHGKLN